MCGALHPDNVATHLQVEMYQDDPQRDKGRAGLHHETGSYEAVASYDPIAEMEDGWNHYQRDENVMEYYQWLFNEELL